MNNKMSKFSFGDLNGYGSAKAIEQGRLVDCKVMPDDKNNNKFRWRVALSSRCRELSGIAANAYISFSYDSGVVILHLSDSNNGRKLSSPGSASKSDRVYARFTMPKEYIGFFADKNASEIEVSNEGKICFKLV